LNGAERQNYPLADMVFPPHRLVSLLSHDMTLVPGDVIITGTPPGVGLGSGKFLEVGDELHLGIAGLGEQRQKVVAWPGK
ncbi:MAG TPA: fumarylacetoacetate hydrolase family protein, partial [Hyphomicrobiales bacterium]|nr:fumarylacetoacetate hydrolase family protein [Hyphomicrobiales bacterium]